MTTVKRDWNKPGYDIVENPHFDMCTKRGEQARALLIEADRIIWALTVKSDCSLDRNQEFYDAAQWRGKVTALDAAPLAESTNKTP